MQKLLLGKNLIKPQYVIRLTIFLGVLFAVFIGLIIFEMNSCFFQALIFTKIAQDCQVSVTAKADTTIVFPDKGPLNKRRAYTLLPQMISTLENQGFYIEKQAQWPPRLKKLVVKGFYPVYQEKDFAGLCVKDKDEQELFCEQYPINGYLTFAAIPEVIVKTLLFIEDRHLLDTTNNMKNPTIRWTRFIKAFYTYTMRRLGLPLRSQGASTLATQIEKYRYSSGGFTSGAREKYSQMISASLRVYQKGRNTIERRRNLVRDYLNTNPLSGYPDYGEVNGLGEGLEVWYNCPFDSVNQVLNKFNTLDRHDSLISQLEWEQAGHYYRMVVSLFIAQRRPTYFLRQDTASLRLKTDQYLRLLRQKGIIDPTLCTKALSSSLVIRTGPLPKYSNLYAFNRKSENIVSPPILSLLKLDGLHELDRFDISVESELDGALQTSIVTIIDSLGSIRGLDSLSLPDAGIKAKNPPERINYSCSLYETQGNYNLLRVKAQTYNPSLLFNEYTRLKLGSTAMVRTLITYLEIIESLYHEFQSLKKETLTSRTIGRDDFISLWVRKYLLSNHNCTLQEILDASLERQYSANPQMRFYTGGGLYLFANSISNDDSRQISIRQGFQRSVNLVFIRLMKDIVTYYLYRTTLGKEILHDKSSPASRDEYLKQFAQGKGQVLINRFYRELQGIATTSLVDSLADYIHLTPDRLATLYNAVTDTPSQSGLQALLVRCGIDTVSQVKLSQLLKDYAPKKYNLIDQGFISTVHPLKIAVAAYLARHPSAPQSDINQAMIPHILETYRWLYKALDTNPQDKRISTILEREAFYEIHKSWVKLGYPFPDLIPSYATALGASIDQLAALTELVSIILNEGIRYPVIKVRSISFAENTPFETTMRPKLVDTVRVLSSEVAKSIKQCLFEVVEKGTASALHNIFKSDAGVMIPLGGKTGSNDHHYKMHDHRDRQIEEKATIRTATFLFIIGKRFYGAITVLAPGDETVNSFTSNYPMQLLNHMAPFLQKSIKEPRNRQ